MQSVNKPPSGRGRLAQACSKRRGESANQMKFCAFSIFAFLRLSNPRKNRFASISPPSSRIIIDFQAPLPEGGTITYQLSF